MNKSTSLFFTTILVLIFGCTQNNDTTKDEISEVKATKTIEKACTYSVQDASSTLYWTAYKHTQKVEVKGIIDSILLSNSVESENILKAIEGTSFSIFPSSVDSKDEGRDKKIREHFFEIMESKGFIEGRIQEVSKTGKDIKAKIELTLNGQTVSLLGDIEINDNIIKLRCGLDFNSWNASKSLDALNEVCSEKHTGIDGENILWPDAKILVEVTASKNCQ